MSALIVIAAAISLVIGFAIPITKQEMVVTFNPFSGNV